MVFGFFARLDLHDIEALCILKDKELGFILPIVKDHRTQKALIIIFKLLEQHERRAVFTGLNT